MMLMMDDDDDVIELMMSFTQSYRGHKLSHYSKILNYAKQHQIRVVGLNVPATVVQVCM